MPDTLTSVSADDIRGLLEARHGDPFGILGPHPVAHNGAKAMAIRAILPGAESVEAIFERGGERRSHPLNKVDADGFFEGFLPGDARSAPRYWLRGRLPGGHDWVFEDPYRFPRVLGDLDLHLHAEGNHLRSFDKLGSHVIHLEGVRGVHFSVWAPNAERVSVVGDFNGWDGRRHPMRNLGASGVWEIFIPALTEGDLYKFEIRNREGFLRLKSDPYGARFEYRPSTSTIVHDTEKYQWNDRRWLESRARWNWLEAPISIYEVHLGSWKRVPDQGNRYLTYRELAHDLPDYAIDMGFTHLQLLPVQEHPLDASWGYQTIGYFAPTSRFGTPDDFMYFVDMCHQKGLGVLLDWVPAHFPRDDHGLRMFDGTCLYEHADPRRGEHRDWGTLIFNYGRNEVKNYLIANALFWLEKFHLDGLRVDAVASMLYLDYSRQEGDWVPNQFGGKENLEAIEFLKRFNELCHRYFPGVLTVAEESTAWTGVSRPTYVGGLGFSMKWNMGWMNDILSYFALDPVHRKYHHHSLTFGLLYAFTENFILPLSHDEVVHGKRSLLDKMPGDAWQKFANLRLLLGFQFTHPGKKLLFQGGEFGQGQEWNCEQSLDWHLLGAGWHQGVQRFVRDLNRLYRTEPALHRVDFEWNGFEWIDFRDWEASLIAFIRRGRNAGEEVIVILNFTPVPRGPYRLGVPSGGYYREILNSDAAHYAGSGQGNLGGVEADAIPSHGRPCSINVTVPALSMLVFKKS